MNELTNALDNTPRLKSAKPMPVVARLLASRVEFLLNWKRPRGVGGWRMLKLTIGFHSAPNFMVWRPLIRLTFSIKWKTFSNSRVGWYVALPKVLTLPVPL